MNFFSFSFHQSGMARAGPKKVVDEFLPATAPSAHSGFSKGRPCIHLMIIIIIVVIIIVVIIIIVIVIIIIIIIIVIIIIIIITITITITIIIYGRPGVLEVRRVFLRSWLSLGNSLYNAIPGDYYSPYYH